MTFLVYDAFGHHQKTCQTNRFLKSENIVHSWNVIYDANTGYLLVNVIVNFAELLVRLAEETALIGVFLWRLFGAGRAGRRFLYWPRPSFIKQRLNLQQSLVLLPHPAAHNEWTQHGGGRLPTACRCSSSAPRGTSLLRINGDIAA